MHSASGQISICRETNGTVEIETSTDEFVFRTIEIDTSTDVITVSKIETDTSTVSMTKRG